MRFLFLLIGFVVVWFLPNTAFAQTNDYSENFVGGSGYSPGSPQYDNWIAFRASLISGSYDFITVSGTNNPTGITCSNSATTTLIANALNAGATSSFSCGGQTWKVGTCGTGIELTVGSGGVCGCNTNAFTIRPTLSPGNRNWGGTGGGSTCNAPSQTLTVSLGIDQTPPTIAVSVPVLHSGSSFLAEFEFSKAVTGFIIADINVTNGSASNFATINAGSYTATITPSGNFDVTVGVVAGAAQDLAGNLLSNSDQDISIFIPTTTGGGGINRYSEDFVGGSGYSPGSSQYDNWVSFRAGLTSNSYNSITVSGTNNPTGISCSNSATATLIANALNTGSTSSYSCDGQTWKTGTCGTGIELSVGASGICRCSTNAFTLRPTLSPGNRNWGSAGGGSTCNAPSQNLTVELNVDSEAPLVTITNVPATTDGATPFSVTFTFSESITGLLLSEIQASLINATASNLVETIPGVRFTVTITPDGSGAITIGLAAAVVQDNAGNDNDAAVNQIVALSSPANLSASKTVAVFDPLAEGLFSLPGNDVTYTITIANTGGGPSDADTIVLIDRLPPEMTFFNGDADGIGPETDPVIFTVIVGPTGLDPFVYANDVSFSDSTTAPVNLSECTYAPAAGLDEAVTFICFNPKGALLGGNPDPSFSLSFRAHIR